MSNEIEVCAVCAWREACQKKFSLSGKEIRCPDFVRDISLGEETEIGKNEEGERR